MNLALLFVSVLRANAGVDPRRLVFTSGGADDLLAAQAATASILTACGLWIVRARLIARATSLAREVG